MIRQSVATELQKVSNLISKTSKDDSDKILTREEVCKLLDVSTTTLFNWNRDGILVNQKRGRRVYYSKASVMSMFNDSKTLN
jgi:phage terminase Nu1 subunit (DNA packaging protein)